MRILFENVDFSSRNGPNSFGLRIARALSFRGHQLVDSDPDVRLAFIQSNDKVSRAPVVQRLDGVWFNLDQPWRQLNEPIKWTFEQAQAVIAQSEFDRRLITTFFGEHPNIVVIHNGIDQDEVIAADPLDAPSLQGVEKVWVCAASWRPHKRLSENIRYFLEHSGERDCLVIAGSNPDVRIAHHRIFYAGDLDHNMLFSLYRAADYFISLAWLDHCPNAVIEARAAGAHVICTSAGGTEEVAGLDSTVIEEDEWDFKPCKLYQPPQLDFSRKRPGKFETNVDIRYVAEQYERVLKEACTPGVAML